MNFGKKLQEARKKADFTQEQLAEVLSVSRSAVAKWENDKGLPDLENIKAIAKLLDVSIDYLLDDGTKLDYHLIKKPIDLNAYGDEGKMSRIKKVKIKEKIVRDEFPNAEINRLTITKIKNANAERVTDEAIGWFALILDCLPLFGTLEMGKMMNSLDQQYYLVAEDNKQKLVLLTDEFITVQQLIHPIKDKKFEIGDKEFLRVGNVD